MDLNNAMENDLILILRTLNQIAYTMYSLILYILSNIQNNTHTKGQLILKCPFGVFKSPKKTNEIFYRISALASKKRSNWRILFQLTLFFDLTSF